jgi:hypothetical protein
LSNLYAIVTGSDQWQLAFDFGLWTHKINRDLIRAGNRVKLYRAYQQNPELVEEWKKATYSKIRRLATEEGASIFFEDEASVRTDHHAGTTRAPTGAYPGRRHDRRAQDG